jgi:PAS domain S-box-containing protein
MFTLSSARSRAIAAGAVGLLLLSGVSTTAVVDRVADTTVWLAIGLSAAAFVMVATTVAVVILSTIRPLAALQASVRAIAAGDLRARAEVSGPEEVASLARDFNAMTDALAANTEALRQSEQRYRLLAENVTDVIWAMDLNLRLTYVSPSVTRLRGYTVQEAMAQTLKEYLTPASLEVVKKVLAEERAIEESEGSDPSRSRTLELEQTCKDGSTVWSEIKLSFLREEDNRPVGILGDSRDITERKRAEEALRQSEERYHVLADNVPALFSYVDADGRYQFVNKRYEEWFGVSATEIIGKHYSEVLGEATYGQIRERVDTVLSGQPVRYEEALAYRHGGTRWVTADYVPHVDDEGEVRGFFALVSDVSQRKRAEEALRESEERYRTIVENVNDALIVHDFDGEILAVNANACTLFGRERGEIVGKRINEFTSEESSKRVGPHLERLFKQGSMVFDSEAENSDGSVIPISVSARVVSREGKGIIQSFLRDITARRRAEEALQKAREEIESRVERRMQQVNGYGLTFRELAVLHLVAAGQADKQIAAVLGISPLTAHKHIANILDKMGAASRTEAGVRALREGLLE